MAEYTYQNTSELNQRIDWAAIWGGVFSFLAIWAVFGALGLAIFASAASPEAARPVMGMSVGMGAWAVILTIIAMYVAGRVTGRLAAVNNRHDGLIHGMMMFGLSFAAAVILSTLGGTGLSGGAGATGNAHSSYVIGMVADLGWIGFFTLFFGWLAAMFGASAGVLNRRPGATVQEIRPDIRTAA